MGERAGRWKMESVEVGNGGWGKRSVRLLAEEREQSCRNRVG